MLVEDVGRTVRRFFMIKSYYRKEHVTFEIHSRLRTQYHAYYLTTPSVSNCT